LFSAAGQCQEREVFLAAYQSEGRALQDKDKNGLHGRLIVLKFGSSVLRTRVDLPNVVHEIYRWYRSGYEVIAVVSAIGLTTDELLCEAREVAGFGGHGAACASNSPEPYALAELLATGERTSAALLGVALDRAGVPARVLNPREIGLIAAGSPLDSELLAVKVERVRELLNESPVLVVPGFFGTDPEGRTHLLGRGGSDLTAVFLAQTLRAQRCRLIKDVDGIYESDPANSSGGAAARRFSALDYATALKTASTVIQPKAVSFLRLCGGRAEVAACARPYESTVHAGPTALDDAGSSEPSRVLLLGLGTVGLGVYQRLLANTEHFQVIGALVRDRGKYERLGAPGGLLRTRSDQVLKLRADLVVDALPGVESSRELVQHFLSIGVPVVSANKALIAEGGAALTALTRDIRTLRYSAAVGGAAPMIEAVDRCAGEGPIASIAAVPNGTCNFVLDRCAEGLALDDAVAEAQRSGFAEVDAHEDLSGKDAARKLTILSRHAFGANPKELSVAALDQDVARRAREARRTRRVLRQVARAARFDSEMRAVVGFEEVPEGSPFGRLEAEWNALHILMKGGQLCTVSGRGAGRWPTAEAVMADLFDLRRSLYRPFQRQGSTRLEGGTVVMLSHKSDMSTSSQ
jgi:homoserine dehydrogenase